jgi:hypothetical protein
MTTKEKAAELRAALKGMGYSSRRVSVRVDSWTTGSAIRVMVRDPQVDYKAVEKLASSYKRIDRCEITGDILSGGNCYVDVNRSCRAVEPAGL